jgi:hypothetical protein
MHLSMDFVTGLPPALNRHGEVVDAVLVIVDRLSKYARYLDCSKDMTAKQLADLLESEIVTHWGVPKSFVTDRGSLFTSKYWSYMLWR